MSYEQPLHVSAHMLQFSLNRPHLKKLPSRLWLTVTPRSPTCLQTWLNCEQCIRPSLEDQLQPPALLVSVYQMLTTVFVHVCVLVPAMVRVVCVCLPWYVHVCVCVCWCLPWYVHVCVLVPLPWYVHVCVCVCWCLPWYVHVCVCAACGKCIFSYHCCRMLWFTHGTVSCISAMRVGILFFL